MSFTKTMFWVVVCGFAVYHIVDDKTRAQFDNGVESQNISLSEFKNDIYLFFVEMGGTDGKELEAEKLLLANEIKLRKEALDEKVKALENNRLPADDSKKYEKLNISE